MQGILLEKAGGDYALVDNLEKPKPGKNQVLVRSLVAGLNPVEDFQRNGILVDSWPIVLGCDASGVVVELGEDVTKFKEGDGIFGCSRLGAPGHGTFQEYFLMNENLAFKRPAKISAAQASTIGVGILTSALGLFKGNKIDIEPKKATDESDWVIILGATGAVGQFGTQLAQLCGYKVLASCSPANDELIKSLGANATFSHRAALEEQLKEIRTITSGRFSRVFDASAMGTETALKALTSCSEEEGTKYFATTNDWVPIEPQKGIDVYMVALGVIGKTGDAHVTTVNEDMIAMIPKLETFVEKGLIRPMEYEQVSDVGVGGV
ncbi:chaperonin 10-like protein, partial [Halenospora varia]